MPEYRRWRIAGGTYFFTVVTYRRRPLLCRGNAPTLFSQALRGCRERLPFRVDAIVLLPDHLHAIWTLPPGDDDFSRRWAIVKSRFAKTWNAERDRPADRVDTRQDRRLSVWQPRFWERCVRDEEEFEAYCDYIHYNPVKHGSVAAPRDWRWSSFHRWAKAGAYHPAWGETLDDKMEGRFARIADRTGE